MINRNGRLDPVEDELPDIFEGFGNRDQVGDLAALYQSERAEREVVGLILVSCVVTAPNLQIFQQCVLYLLKNVLVDYGCKQ